MHIELENLPNCVTSMRVELPPERVAEERQNILRDFQGSARLPGYRAGKAPRGLVEVRYKKEIADELRRKLVSAGTREAIAEKKLRVLSIGEVEQVELAPDSTLRFTAKVVTAPEFEMPGYMGLAVKTPPSVVTEEDLDRTLENLRVRFADFADIEGRGLEMNDFAVIDFAGRFEDKPFAETFPGAPKTLGGQENFWVKLTPASMLPGFSEALLGAAAGETRDFALDIPADFAQAPALAGKRLDYTVKVRELKRQILPELDDAFAEKLLPGKTYAEVRAQVRTDLEAERGALIEEAKRRQIVSHLVGATQFDLPSDFVRGETRRIMSDIVRQNQDRGVTDEEIRHNQEEIVANAGVAARERLKSAFILVRIAEKEGIKVSREELDERLESLARRHQMTRQKLTHQLEERNALGSVEEELLIAKTLAFLSANASVETDALMPPEATEETPG